MSAAMARLDAAVKDSNEDATPVAAAVARETNALAAHPDLQARVLATWAAFASTVAEGAGQAAVKSFADEVGPDAARALAVATLRALHANASHEGLMVAALSVLATLGRALPAAQSQAVIRAAVDAARGSGDFAATGHEVASAGCWALHTFVVNSEHKARVAVDAGALEALVTAMRSFPLSDTLQRRACIALRALFISAAALELQADERARAAAEATVATLRAFSQDAPLVVDAAWALRAIVYNDKALEVHALVIRAPEALLVVIRSHGNNADVVHAACAALSYMRLHPAEVSPFVAEAAVDTLKRALRTHAAHVPTQEHGLRALGSAFFHPHAAAHAAATGIVADVTRTMCGHRTEPFVQGGCCMLLILLKRQHSSTALAGEDALSAVASVVDVLRVSSSSSSSADAAAWERSAERCRASYGHAHTQLAIQALVCLVNSNPTGNGLRAVHAGALSVLQTQCARAAAGDSSARLLAALVTRPLQALAEEHVRLEPACAACAALRARGAMCGAAGCAACARPPDGGRLLVCARCRRAAYCGPEHQRQAWLATHKAECARCDAAEA